MKNSAYTQEVKLNHNESAARVDNETGEVVFIKKRINNLPEGKSPLKYKNFALVNEQALKILKRKLTNEELGVILYMISLANFNSNSLKPLNNETSSVVLSDIFGVDRRRVKSMFNKFYELGVYNSYNTFSVTESESKTYWILSPYISWKGKLVDDSIFYDFSDTELAKLLK